MELNNLILEQTEPNYSDWNSTEPKDYASNKSKYILKYIKVGGKPVQHYKLVTTTNNTTTSTPNTTTTTPVKKADESKFACIKNSNTKGKNLQQSDTNPEVYIFVDTDGTEFEFWDNGNFAVWDGSTRAIGKWKCKGSNNFDANIEWKGETHYFRSETNQWSVTPNAKKINENTIKKIVSKNLKSLIK